MDNLKERIDAIHDPKAIPHFHKIRRAIEEAAPETAEDLDWIAAKFETLTRTTRGQESTIKSLQRNMYGKHYRGRVE